MRFPRFRIRTLMIAVAVLGLMLAARSEGMRLWRLSRAHRQRAAAYARYGETYRYFAAEHEQEAAKYRSDAESYRRRLPAGDTGGSEEDGFLPPFSEGGPGGVPFYRARARLEEARAALDHKSAVEYTEKAEHFAELKRSHERAARRPWEAGHPDPFAPEEGRSPGLSHPSYYVHPPRY